MPITQRKKTIYIIPPPFVSEEVASLMEGWTKPVIPAKQTVRGLLNGLVPPSTEDICDYLRAFYNPLQVKVLNNRYKWQAWEDRPVKKVVKDSYIGLANTGPSAGLTRVRYRRSLDKIAKQQLNLNDITDAMLEDISADAYAIAMLTDHDLYEDEDDDFCCGRAYGRSRVAIVSSFRYNPALSKYAGINLEHMWPASHCKSYIDFVCGQMGVSAKPAQTTEPGVLSITTGSPLTAAVAAAMPVMVPKSAEDFAALWLARTSRTASHELGHCFGMDHCVYYACAMQGTASIAEDDRQPPYLCPVCLSKMSYAIATHLGKKGAVIELQREWLKQHYAALAAFCERFKDRAGMFAGLRAWIGSGDKMAQDYEQEEML